MKITIATTTGFHLRHLARELIHIGHEVTYISYMPPYRIKRDGIPTDCYRSLFYKLLPYTAGALFRHLPNMQSFCIQKMKELTDNTVADMLGPCDVFIGLSSMAVKSAEVAREKFGAKVIIERGSRHVLSQQKILANSPANLDDSYVKRELASYEQADFVALPSKHAVDSFLEYDFPFEKIFLNCYGVDIRNFSPSKKPLGPISLVFVGGWSTRKGVDILTSAIIKHNDILLKHAGVQVDYKFPESDNFYTFGHVRHEKLSDIYNHNHILVLPSREDGFGMVLLEALSSGLGVIASEITGGPDIRKVIERKEFVKIVEPGSVTSLVEGIHDMKRVIRMQDNCREILTAAERDYFTWQAYARRYSDFLETIA